MADDTFRMTLPLTKAVDLGDGTYAKAVVVVAVPGGGTDTVYKNKEGGTNSTDPPLKAVDLGDDTYAIKAIAQ
ncbi:MAG: hypothetical protein KKD77_21770 [Gammaproteobacteria bacterium]|nr:hypothetical protein [Gammaproteobacteria bacterium]